LLVKGVKVTLKTNLNREVRRLVSAEKKIIVGRMENAKFCSAGSISPVSFLFNRKVTPSLVNARIFTNPLSKNQRKRFYKAPLMIS